jgi:hypothetical protein
VRFLLRDLHYWCDKSVSTPRDGFNILRGTGIIVQCLSQPIHRFIQGLIEVNESISPDLFLQFLTGDDLARTLRKQRQNSEGLLLQSDRHAMFPQLRGVAVKFVHSEPDLARHPIAPLPVTLPQKLVHANANDVRSRCVHPAYHSRMSSDEQIRRGFQ